MSLLDFFSRKIGKSGRVLIASAALMTGGLSAKTPSKDAPTKAPIVKKDASAKLPVVKTDKEWISDTIKQTDDLVLETMVTHLRKWENVVAHPYLDKGVLTVGVGCHIFSYDDFKEFDFKNSNGTSLTEKEKKEFYLACLKYQKETGRSKDNYKASYFGQFMKYHATDESIDTALEKRILKTRDDVIRLFGKENYYNLAPEAQALMIEMAFNLGENKFFKQYPKFLDAARKRDYDTMEKECHRKGVSEPRNNAGKAFCVAAKQRKNWLRIGTLDKNITQRQMLIAQKQQATR